MIKKILRGLPKIWRPKFKQNSSTSSLWCELCNHDCLVTQWHTLERKWSWRQEIKQVVHLAKVVLERDACPQYKMFKGECIYQTEKLTSKFYRRWPSSTKRNSQGTPAKKKNQQESFLIFVVVIINHGTFSENFHSHSCFLSKLWQRLQMCRKLSTVQLTERLDYSNLPGLNPNMKNGRWVCMKFMLLVYVRSIWRRWWISWRRQ